MFSRIAYPRLIVINWPDLRIARLWTTGHSFHVPWTAPGKLVTQSGKLFSELSTRLLNGVALKYILKSTIIIYQSNKFNTGKIG